MISKTHNSFTLALFLSLAFALALAQSPGPTSAAPQGSPEWIAQNAALPPGFKMEVYASGLDTPRFISFSPEGDLYVAEFTNGSSNIKVLPDRNHDGKPDKVVGFAGNFLLPNNVAFRQGAVYVAAENAVWKLTDTNGDLVADTRSLFIGGLPANGRHRTKTIEFGPDGRLYMDIGSFSDDAVEGYGRANIFVFNGDGSGGKPYATGLRNTVGFDWDPTTGQMWGVENGPDDLGPNFPPDELNQIVEGGNYGFPYCMGNRQQNLPGLDCSKTIAPAVTFVPHAAPLAMTFYTGWSFPSSYWGGIFTAQRSVNYPANRAIVFVPFKDGKPSGPPQTFASTGATWVGVAVDPYDGSIFATQDQNGVIYRISYTGAPAAPVPPTGPASTPVPGKPAPKLADQLPGLSRCFPQTGKCLRGAFLNYWFTHGNIMQLGLPVTDELTETLSDGKTYTVQYTERARLEWHPENRGKESQVLLGRLGADLAASRGNEQPFKPVPPCGSCGLLYFQQTGHAIGQEFAAYWQSNGGIPVFGYPLSEAFDEKSPTDGKTYTVQYFERNRLEYHPENKGTPYEVLLGLLGVQTYQNRYGARP